VSPVSVRDLFAHRVVVEALTNVLRHAGPDVEAGWVVGPVCRGPAAVPLKRRRSRLAMIEPR